MSELNNLVFKILGEHPFSGRLYGMRRQVQDDIDKTLNGDSHE